MKYMKNKKNYQNKYIPMKNKTLSYKEARRPANLRLHFKALSVYKRGIDSERQRP